MYVRELKAVKYMYIFCNELLQGKELNFVDHQKLTKICKFLWIMDISLLLLLNQARMAFGRMHLVS